jgi:DNA-binding NtrC family response regulator
MPKPMLAVMSHRSDWTRSLSTEIADFEIRSFTSLEELLRESQVQRPAATIADLRGIVGHGGHLQEGLLGRLRDQLGDSPIAMLTDDRCPEPLERRALYSGILHLTGEVSVSSVLDWLAKSTHVRPSMGGEELSVDEPCDAGTVMAGITRRFETHTPSIKRMLEDLAIAAEKDVTLLLIGETGAGKTYLSNLIHEVSHRRDQPFITVACGALPGDLIESELFGHVKGSFTSAHADKEGKFVAAGKGTILLDEIDVLSPEQQVKLLRVIETGQFEPVGSNRTQTSQARLVVASNLALEPLVQQGKFRPDLYYRLSMLKFDLPPLRQRKPDIKPMARRFIQAKSKKHNVPVVRIEQEFFDALNAYPWPGNVRELEYAIEKAVIYCKDGVIRGSNLAAHILAGVAGPTNDPSVQLEPTKVVQKGLDLSHQVAATEKDVIEHALLRNNFNRTKTAKELGVSRVTLYNKMKRYGID